MWKYRRFRVSQSLRNRIDQAVERLNYIAQDHFSAIYRILFDRTLKVMAPDERIILFFVRNHARPMHEALIAFDTETKRAFFPRYVEEDYFALVDLFSLETPLSRVSFYLLCRVEYGITRKGIPPVRIRSADDLREVGIEENFDLSDPELANYSIWWLKYWGRLLKFRILRDGDLQKVEIEEMSDCKGNYKMPPTSTMM
jgi:hypothetical protein